MRGKVLAISAASLDRLLAPCRARHCGSRPPSAPTTGDVGGPGCIEADTVAHCGLSMAGEFCRSLTATDVFTQWTETRAVSNRGQHSVCGRLAKIEAALPFPILGVDTDNGGEFLNWHVVDYFRNRPKVVNFTRSRAYHKNDNARVEQKNWTHACGTPPGLPRREAKTRSCPNRVCHRSGFRVGPVAPPKWGVYLYGRHGRLSFDENCNVSDFPARIGSDGTGTALCRLCADV